MLLNVVSNSNEEQHLLAKLAEMVYNIIILYIDLYHFSIIIFVFSPEAFVPRSSLKGCS